MTLDVDVRVRVGAFALEVALTARPGEVLAVLGPNGSGKSTLLGAIAGHYADVSGRIRLAGRELNGARPVPIEERRVGLLGQRAMLFPHLSAVENVAFGMRAQGTARAAARDAARELLGEVGLADLADRRPAELSGGQQQRVAIARALAARPQALLLDEPFSALDAQTAMQARRLVAELRDRSDVPMVLVTHDPVDAVVLADRTAVVHEGRIVQQGETAEVLGHPRSPFVAAVAGVNLLPVTGAADGAAASTDGLRWRGHGDALAPGEPGTVVFAPAAVRVRKEIAGEASARAAAGEEAPRGTATAEPNAWQGTVSVVEPVPGGIRITAAEHPSIAVDLPPSAAVAARIGVGVRLSFSVAADDVSVRRDG